MFRKYIYPWIKRDPVRFSSLHADMISARIGVTPEQYVWRSLKISILMGLAFAALGFVASLSLTLPSMNNRIGIANVFDIQMPVFFNTLYPAAYLGAGIPVLSHPCPVICYRHVPRVCPDDEDPRYREDEPGDQDQYDPP